MRADMPSRSSERVSWLDLRHLRGEWSVCEGAVSDAGWKHVATTDKEGRTLSIYSRTLASKGGLSEYLFHGTLPLNWDVYFALNADHEYRKAWDASCSTMTELLPLCHSGALGDAADMTRSLHWEVQLPMWFGSQDYVYQQNFKFSWDDEGHPMRCASSSVLPHDDGLQLHPPRRGVRRVDDYRSYHIIWPGHDDRHSGFVMVYFEDFKLKVPGSIQAWATTSQIPSQLEKIVQVGMKYPPERLRWSLDRFGIVGASNSSLRAVDDGGVCSSGDEFFSGDEGETTTAPFIDGITNGCKAAETHPLRPVQAPTHASAKAMPGPIVERFTSTAFETSSFQTADSMDDFQVVGQPGHRRYVCRLRIARCSSSLKSGIVRVLLCAARILRCICGRAGTRKFHKELPRRPLVTNASRHGNEQIPPCDIDLEQFSAAT